MIFEDNIIEGAVAILGGSVIAYPTEAIFGLGCDPFNETAVRRLLEIKKRDESKGLILLTHSWDAVASLIQPLTDEQRETLETQYRGPLTWLLPASETAPKLITGGKPTIAIRIPRHPTAFSLCQAFGKPIVSSSANVSGEEPARCYEEAFANFSDQVDFIMNINVGIFLKPTPIKDLLTGEFIRR